MLGVFSNILSQRGHRRAKLLLMSAIVPYVAFKEVVHEMVCLSESHQGLMLLFLAKVS